MSVIDEFVKEIERFRPVEIQCDRHTYDDLIHACTPEKAYLYEFREGVIDKIMGVPLVMKL